MSTPPYSAPYCLYCYAPLDDFEGASTACARCGKPNLRVDQQLFWTREKKLREWEDLLKLFVALFAGGLTALALLHPGIGTGKGHGMAIGAPILLAVLLWDAASITRRESLYRQGIIWPVIGMVVLAAALLTLPVGALFASVTNAVVGCIGLGICALFLLTPLLGRRWRRWREHHVATLQARFE